jgi:hypothetical protein
MLDPPLPPIMRTPGLRLIAIGTDQKGRTYLKFSTDSGRHPNIVVLLTNRATKVTYAYTVVEQLDDITDSVTTHVGPYGDPALDPTNDTFLWP